MSGGVVAGWSNLNLLIRGAAMASELLPLFLFCGSCWLWWSVLLLQVWSMLAM